MVLGYGCNMIATSLMAPLFGRQGELWAVLVLPKLVWTVSTPIVCVVAVPVVGSAEGEFWVTNDAQRLDCSGHGVKGENTKQCRWPLVDHERGLLKVVTRPAGMAPLCTVCEGKVRQAVVSGGLPAGSSWAPCPREP